MQRLLTANRLVASVEHPGLPRGIDAGETDGASGSATVHVDAQPLSARFARTGPSHINELKPILRGILEPLAALHKARIVHGDLKLENVLVGAAAPTAGIRGSRSSTSGPTASASGPTVANGHTGVLAVFGSPKTIAPEQVRGLRADSASDVYAFGAMMYELLSGKPVFAFESATDAAFAHVVAGRRGAERQGAARLGHQGRRPVRPLAPGQGPGASPEGRHAVLDHARVARPRLLGDARRDSPSSPRNGWPALIDLLVAAPDDAEAAIALEEAIEEGADATEVAEAFDRPRTASTSTTRTAWR